MHELEQELARLRYEGQTYQDDLKKQLEGARQAAMQARHEAGQAHARATHEASLVSQLQDDKKRLSDIVDSWKRQGREQQVCTVCHSLPFAVLFLCKLLHTKMSLWLSGYTVEKESTVGLAKLAALTGSI